MGMSLIAAFEVVIDEIEFGLLTPDDNSVSKFKFDKIKENASTIKWEVG